MKEPKPASAFIRTETSNDSPSLYSVFVGRIKSNVPVSPAANTVVGSRENSRITAITKDNVRFFMNIPPNWFSN